MAAAFDLAANAELPSQYPQIPASTGVHTVPSSVLKAVGWVESGWRQFTPQGRPLLSFDFGYGIMQITSGMAGAFGNVNGSIAPEAQSRIASDYTYNIAFGAFMLAEKWASVPKIGDADPAVVENWYYALWAYNGWGWVNNPNNPRFSRSGTPATNPGAFPYQERVLYLVAHPPKDADGNPMWKPVPVTLPPSKLIGTNAPPIAKLARTHREPAPGLSVAYRPGGLNSLPAGGKESISVKVTNTGTQPWTVTDPTAVSLTYHLFTMMGDPFKPISPFSPGVIAFGQGGVVLPHTVLPGMSTSVHMMVQAPPTPGRYRVVWDLEQGVQLWFSATGALPRVQILTVVGGGTPTVPPAPSPTALTARPEGMLYVADTSIRDGSTLSPREKFRKGWLVFNDGETAWDTTWTLRLVSGKGFGVSTIHVPAGAPCRSVNIVTTMKAPSKPGAYSGTWRLRDPQGRRIGQKLTVVITVRGAVKPTPTPRAATPTPTPKTRATPTAPPTPAG